MKLISNYKDHDRLRCSFNNLAQKTFGISFEQWYQAGYWTDKYIPYSYALGEEVVANVSVNKVDLLINGQITKAIQIGTVMTHPNYRYQGLSRRLMERVMNDYHNTDAFYLFANREVLEFYPKFGFTRMEEFQFTMPVEKKKESKNTSSVIKLNAVHQADRSFIYGLAAERVPASKRFSTVHTAELFMYYCMCVFKDNIYYLEQENCILLCKTIGEELHIFDVLSQKGRTDWFYVAELLGTSETTKLVFHFIFDDQGYPVQSVPYKDDHVLFVQTKQGVEWPGNAKHSLTSQA
ncbi:Acetyltransferase (GNAT) domain-containing protein [Bacillus sp. OV194]|nr:Acetyltransferase (GNAT) domain-containing protein [Bacillus sp. OV194]